ncbi:Carotenoid 9,109',10'-cleavage dioxygenase [Hondaea fermentalgiana]|uniref:Carotenoid 9,109',10'-cleavage dioxygenase n=1 Tax=Hondaea fermentalgiana TaxID=2315210 RepID=A0A2R5G3F8_9STRA|nr:Carotenoid 9,109',10'-cleavage dioxygenase [Hondaea fermentalgiana]|eukprot:GBG25065.1 Carotenoid 9,109',10'-cleavage dioxygenase [Hondaea fermentalgiana]
MRALSAYTILVSAVGLFAHVTPCVGVELNMREISSQEMQATEGRLPSWVDGVFYLNGPSIHNFSEFGVDLVTGHFFDGLGGVAAFELRNGGVTLTTRIIESETYTRLRDMGQYDSLTFGTPMSWSSVLQRPFDILVDNTPINLYPYNGRLFATSDSSYRHGVDPSTLATISAHNRDEIGPMGAAHPAVDPHTGEIFNYVGPTRLRLDLQTLEPIAEYHLVQEFHAADGSLSRSTLGKVWAPALWIAHSVSLTEDFVLYRVMSERPRPSLDTSTLSNFLKFNAKANVRVIAASRNRQGGVFSMECNEAFSSFHIINAYTRALSQEIVLDSVASDSSLLNDRTQDVFTEGYKPKHARPNKTAEVPADSVSYFYKRCILRGLPLQDALFTPSEDTTPTCTCSNLFRYPFELATINPVFRMQRHRYVWSGAGREHTLWINQIAKFDLQRVRSRENETNADFVSAWNAPDGFVVGEPRMIPRAVSAETDEEAAEDDGVVMFLLYHESKPVTKLVTLDAATMEVVAIHDAPIDLPVQVHGVYKDMTRDGRIFAN